MGSTHKTNHLHGPSTSEAAQFIQEALEFDQLITIAGVCAVDYDGRASSFFDYCDCFVVIKPDGTFLIHQNDGRKPTNWQPPGCEFTVGTYEDELVVLGERKSAGERVEVHCPDVYAIMSYNIEESEEKELFGTEKQMQDRIMENPELIEPGFQPVAAEYQLDVGAVDIFGRDSSNNPIIVELKRRRTGPDAVDQIKRYLQEYEPEPDKTVRGILVAPSFTDTTISILESEGIDYLELEPDTAGSRTFGLDSEDIEQ